MIINIRKAEKSDIPEIRELFQQTILKVNLNDYLLEQVQVWAARGDGIEVWEKCIAEEYFIVAEVEKQLTGFASLKTNAYLNFMFVHKNFQHKGIASLLLKDIEKQAVTLNVNEITADVSITGKAFFEKNGFVLIKEQIVNIEVEMTNYMMIKVLNN